MITLRKWLSWKLQCVAARIYDGHWMEQITIETPSGESMYIHIVGDEYGCGISAISGIPWDDADQQAGEALTAVVDGWTFTWPPEMRLADWLDNDEDSEE